MKLRWSGPVIVTGTDASDYGIPEGSLFVWAGEADDAGHVEETEWRHLPPGEHDATRNEHGVTMYGADTARWVDEMSNEMLDELAQPPRPKKEH